MEELDSMSFGRQDYKQVCVGGDDLEVSNLLNPLPLLVYRLAEKRPPWQGSNGGYLEIILHLVKARW